MKYEVTIERVSTITVIVEGHGESEAEEIGLSMSEEGLLDWSNPDSWFTEVSNVGSADW